MIPRAAENELHPRNFPRPAVVPGTRRFRVPPSCSALASPTDPQEKQLSYAAYSPFFDRAVASGGVYVSTARPDRC